MPAPKFFKRLLFLFSLGMAGALILAMLAMYVSPETFWMLAFMGLTFPLLILVNLLLLIIWLFVYPRRALVQALVLIIAFPFSRGMFNFTNRFRESNPDENSFVVMSYNVRLFDLYNWTSNKKTRDSIIDLVHTTNADVVCFQEFFHEDTGKFNTLDTLKKTLRANKVHIDYSAHVKNVNHWGIATFSRFPIVGKGKLEFPDETDNISIFTDLRIEEDTFRVYNLHLESVRFRTEDYKALESITGKQDETGLGGPQKILSRMRRAYIRRARQTDIIRRHISESPYPVIVCGDFNDPPASYAYHQISATLEDGFKNSSAGFGATYIGKIPFLRIDYVLYDEEYFGCDSMQVLQKEFSDHFPLKAVMHLKTKKTD